MSRAQTEQSERSRGAPEAAQEASTAPQTRSESANIEESAPRWMPGAVRDFARKRHKLVRVLGNVGWLMTERIVAMALGFVVNVWFVRYLGPERLGLYSYSVSFAALFGLVASLGLDALLVRDLTRAPQAEHEILGTALVLRTVAAAVGWMAAAAAVLVLREDALTRMLVAVIATGSFGVAAAVFAQWFEARIAARGPVLARIAVYLGTTATRGLLILLAAPLWAFAALLAVANLATAGAVYGLYRTTRGSGPPLAFQRGRARALLRDAWPLFVSSLAVTVYMKIDQVMLTAMAGEHENGIYAAAVSLSELWYFIPVALASTLFPFIVKARDRLSEAQFEARMQAFYDAMAGLGYAIAVPVALFGRPIVHRLYGDRYDAAAGVLVIHVASFVFVCLGIARARFLLVENLMRFGMVTGLMAAILNVALNLVLIPSLGASGAAWATLISYALANYFSGFFHPGVRRQAWYMTRSLAVLLRPMALFKLLVP